MTSLVELSGIQSGVSRSGSQTGLVQSTEQVRWGSLEASHGPDKSSGGTRKVWYPSLEVGE
jgi:hypothetical protein